MHREYVVTGMLRAMARGAVVVCGILALPRLIEAQALIDPTLNVSTVASGLNQPIAMAFIGPDDMLVTEKASGQVKRVTGGAVTGVVLDLAVELQQRTGVAGHRAAPAISTRAVRVSLQHREYDRRRLECPGGSALARESVWTVSSGTAAR